MLIPVGCCLFLTGVNKRKSFSFRKVPKGIETLAGTFLLNLNFNVCLSACAFKANGSDGSLNAISNPEHSAGGANIGQSPRLLSPGVVQLVQCLRPYGNLSHSQKRHCSCACGCCGQCSVKRKIVTLSNLCYMHFHLSENPSCVCV